MKCIVYEIPYCTYLNLFLCFVSGKRFRSCTESFSNGKGMISVEGYCRQDAKFEMF